MSDLGKICRFADEDGQVDILAISGQISHALAYVQRGGSDLTDHGMKHSKKLIENLNEIISIQNSIGSVEISSFEAKLLYMSALLHDVGCIVSRKNHSVESVKILKGLCPKYISIEEPELTALGWIIKYHTRRLEVDGEWKELKLEDVPDVISISRNDVNLRFMAGFFRLADACDVEAQRAPRIVFEILKETMDAQSVEYWTTHQRIVSLEFNPDKKAVVIWAKEEEDIDLLLNDLADELSTVEDILGKGGFPCLKLLVERIPEVELDDVSDKV